MVLVSPSADEYDLLRKQMLERLEAGNGEIIYDIGQGEGTSFSESTALITALLIVNSSQI